MTLSRSLAAGTLAVLLLSPVSALAEDKDNAGKPYQLNAQAIRKGDFLLTDDIATIERQAKEHPDDAEASFLLAAAYSRTPRLDTAFHHITRTKEILKQSGDFDFVTRKITEYEALGKQYPSNDVVLYRLAMAYYFKGYFLSKPKYATHFEGETGSAASYFKKAETTMSKVVQLNPTDPAARNYLGYLYYDQNPKSDKAIALWKESININSNENPAAYYLLSQAYLKRGDVLNSVMYGAKAVEIQQRMGIRLDES